MHNISITILAPVLSTPIILAISYSNNNYPSSSPPPYSRKLVMSEEEKWPCRVKGNASPIRFPNSMLATGRGIERVAG